mgnify:CR=1 FL=1
MPNLPWSLEYSPKTSKELLIEPSIVQKCINYVKDYKGKKSKNALLLYGKTGVGKTSLVYAIANELDAEILEVNASDTRNKATLKDVLGQASKVQSLFGKTKIILVDEIDGLSGRYDRGAIPELVSIIKESRFPIILTAENPFESKYSKLRSSAQLIEIKPVSSSIIEERLKNILDDQSIDNLDKSLGNIVRNTNGDIRAALNDLQVSLKDDTLIIDDKNENGRDVTASIPQALRTVFKSNDFSFLKDAFANFDGNFYDLFLWFEKNIGQEYTSKNIGDAFEYLSMADVFNGRIRRRQYWRFLVYLNLFMSCGIGTSKDEASRQFVKYEQSNRILQLWIAKRKHSKRDSIVEKIAKHTHRSKSSTVHDIEFYKSMAKDKNFLSAISKELSLEKEEKDWLKG